jgi:Zn-dependent protease/predicted transcriptional regulator
MSTQVGTSFPFVSDEREISPHRPSRPHSPTHGGWSIKVGEARGIELYVHGTFLILLAWIALSHLLHGHGAAASIEGVMFTATIFGIVVLHELGHALTAARYGIRTRDITLYPIGGVASLERIPDNPRQEFMIALAGPAVNVALAAILFGMLVLANAPLGADHVRLVGGSYVAKLMWVNVSLAIFNLLPAFPMDGGRVFRAALALRLGHERATEIAARVGQVMALGFGLLGMLENPILLFIALFVWSGAQAEMSLVRSRSLLRGVSVRQAMIKPVFPLSPSDRLSQAVDAIVARGYHAFPVVRDGEVIGVVTKNGLLEALTEVGPNAEVLAAMDEQFEITDPAEMLEPALERLEARHGKALVVARGGSILGIVTPQSVGELVTMRHAVREHAQD